ncbi:MAG: hypothetical protein H6858_04690 [Rhodospirillales bacterium]|nr:hypothetical protein [Alphaproteobacteria bacterium]MCB9976883.1 hypothetical protein [Rhodospirillales bacterium]
MFDFNDTHLQNLLPEDSGHSLANMSGLSNLAHDIVVKAVSEDRGSLVIDIADVLSGSKLDALISGGRDDDDGGSVIRGTRGDDELEGDTHDTLLGLAGNDVLSTADGNGYNELEGGSGNDELIGNHHDDLDGGPGDDILSTAEGHGYNELEGGRGDDQIEGNHHDVLNGGSGDDILSTADGDGHNVLKGGTGNDILRGGHDDLLYGGSGNDYIELYGGHNIVYGGHGSDLFELADGQLPDEANYIMDFKAGVDKLQIRNIEGLNSFDDLALEQDGRHVIVSFNGHELAVLEKVSLVRLDADDFIIDPVHMPDISASDFEGITVDNPYFPLIPGTKWVYEGMTDEGLERIVVEVLNETQIINGVEATVVRDSVYLDGELKEDTTDWYAQDRDGNVWYLGEDTAEYEGGVVVNTHGTFMWGVDGAQPGIIMFADPSAHVNETYKQESYIGEAEDTATLLSVNETLAVLYGTFTNVVKTLEFTPLEPFLQEQKYYVEGIGFIKQVNLRTGEEFNLVEFYRPVS